MKKLSSKKILIVGEAGEQPWMDGQSSARLWRWFGCRSHRELEERATLMNVYEKKLYDELTVKHLLELRDAVEKHDVVFLVGRVAQKLAPLPTSHVLHRAGKYVYLPHPSGLNRQLNTLSDKMINKYVEEVLI